MSLLPYQLKVLGFKQTDNRSRDGDFILADDGKQVFIAEWLSQSKQPTKDDLEAVTHDAEALRDADVAKAKENAAVIMTVSAEPQAAKVILQTDAAFAAKISAAVAAVEAKP